jgi:spore germination cell wall hydrolase CwlJ-like protein
MKSLAVIVLLMLSGCAPVYARDALTTVAMTIWGEGANQSYEAKHAVASVIWNRSRAKSANFKAVCLAPLQFSCWRKRVFVQPLPDLKKPLDRTAWRDCVALADSMMNGSFLPSIKVKDYAEKRINNYWTRDMVLIAQIGDHNFYGRKAR